MSIERDVEEEIRFHLEMRTQANIDAGMDPDEARADAERRFGDQDQVRDAGRKHLTKVYAQEKPDSPLDGQHGNPHRLLSLLARWPGMLKQDLQVGLRMLRRSPAIAGAAILSLALGIGANTANFSIVYGLLHRALPFPHEESLVFVDAWNPERGDGDAPITWADLDALRTSGAFQAVEGMDTRSFTVTGGDRPERIAGASVTPGLFQVLGVQPQQGRLFLPEEGAEAGFEQVALVSDGLWRGRYGADPEILDQTIHINNREIAVVGVMPPGFRFPEREDIWLPMAPADPSDHVIRSMVGIGRLQDGMGMGAAADAAQRWTQEAATRFPETHDGWSVRAQPLRNGWVDASTRHFMTLLLASVGFVLLLACANVANLLLARASDRETELSVRNALGAGRGRLAHQVLVESLVLGAVGGVLGILVARVWLHAFHRAIPEDLSWWIDISIDAPILLYAIGISLGTSLLFGLLPALRASRANLASAVRSGSRGILGGRGRARAGLVIVEVSLAVVLLVGATMMVRSFMALQAADPGFDDANLLSFRIVQAGDRYDDPAARLEYFREVEERLGRLPGAAAAAVTSAIPADDGGSPVRVLPEGTPEDQALFATAVGSTRGFFNTLDVQLLAGRGFTPAEEADPEADVVVLGRRLADRLWPGQDPVGRTVLLPGNGTFRVVGVAPDLQYEEFGEDLEGARLQLHFPYGFWGSRGMSVLVRADGDPARLLAPVREALAEIDPTLAPYDMLTMRDRRALTTWEQGLFGDSFAVFGAIALILALCGIYGVVSHAVASQTREIGIRIALGARPDGVRLQVVGKALGLAAIGAVLGLLGALAFAQALQGIAFGVSPTDPLVLGGAVTALLLTAAVAGWVPARRAARVDPTEALREE